MIVHFFILLIFSKMVLLVSLLPSLTTIISSNPFSINSLIYSINSFVGFKAGINIADIANPDNATAPQVAGTLNTLLGQLRNAGILI